MSIKKKLKKGDFVIGQMLHHDLYDANGELILPKYFVVKSLTQINGLIARGLYSLSDEDTDSVQAPVQTTGKTPGSSEQEVISRSPFELIDDAYARLSDLFSPQGSKQNFPSRVIDLSKIIQQTCQLDADASLGAILLTTENRYSLIHQIHCALVCEFVLKQMGTSAEERFPLLAAALTMNVAMIELQDALARQKERLTEEQKLAVKEHPLRGVELLRTYDVTDEEWLNTVSQHHEFLDGSGYPQGLSGEKISKNARLLMLADIYCAKLFPRAYRKPLQPDEAAREMFTGGRGQAFDLDLAKVIIKELGIYHPGSFVRLANGEIAMVIRRGEKIHNPVVSSVLKANGSPYLSIKKRDCSTDEFKITGSVAKADVPVSINRLLLWGYA
jgi:HD-GYP domain-containing protein (c-di-GMP phosphodiesterase class II)